MSNAEVTHRYAVANPGRAVSARWILLFSVAWLGLWTGQLTAFQLLLPAQVAEAHTHLLWHETVIDFGWISAASGIAAALAYPLLGSVSDHSRSHWGRRRTLVVAGGLVNAVSVVLLGMQTTLVGVGIFWSVSIVGFCAASAGLTSMICDQVPVNQRGTVSGWIAVPQALGVVLGVSLAQAFTSSTLQGYILLAIVTAALLLPAVLWLPDPLPAIEPTERRALSLRGLLSILWISPTQHPDFAWTLTSRVLVNLSNALGTGLLLYFYTFDLALDDPEGLLQQSVLLYVASAVTASLATGRMSDILSRRKPFILAAGLVQASSGILLALAPSAGTALVAACLLGAGTGAYFAVDQALVTQVLPNPEDHGKDLAIMNIALIVPQSFGPIIGAAAILAMGSFAPLFWLSASVGVVGALVILFVKGAR